MKIYKWGASIEVRHDVFLNEITEYDITNEERLKKIEFEL